MLAQCSLSTFEEQEQAAVLNYELKIMNDELNQKKRRKNIDCSIEALSKAV